MKPHTFDYESITRWKIGQWTIRVWRTEGKPDVLTDADLGEFVKEAIKTLVMDGRDHSRGELLQAFIEFEGVSAVEVTGSDGSGVLQYKDWSTTA